MRAIFKKIKISFFALALLAIGCKQQASNPKKVFKMNIDVGVTSLDPAFARNQMNIWCVNQLFNGLTQLDSNSNTQPAIAQSWDINESGLVYTFHLRSDVYFHDH